MSVPIRERILASFRELAVQKGIKAVTMDELSAHAEISKRTLYRYFRSKEEIIDTFFADLMKDIDWQVNLITTGKGDPVYKFRSIVELISKNIESFQPYIINDLNKYYPKTWSKLEKFRMSKLYFLEALIKEGIKQGYFRPFNAKLVSTGFLSMANAIVNPAFLANSSLSINEVMKQLSDLFFYGISSSNKKLT